MFWYCRPLTIGPSEFNSVNGTNVVYKVVDVLYPFDHRKYPFYQITLIHEIFGVFSVVCLIIGVDPFCCIIVTVICGHFDVIMSALKDLQHNLNKNYNRKNKVNQQNNDDRSKDITDFENSYLITNESKNYLYEELKAVIKDHQKLVT